MTIAPVQARALLQAAPRLVRRDHTIEAALSALGQALGSVFPLVWRASIRRLRPDGRNLVAVAVWSVGGTMLETGMEMSVLATSFPEVVNRDGPVVSARPSADGSFLDQIMAGEGIQSWVSIPLREAGKIIGLLTISSLQLEAFDESDTAFFAQLGVAIEGPLVNMMATGGP